MTSLAYPIREYRYRWVPNGKTFACACGGTARGYDVEPKRSPKYINHVFVCDNRGCMVNRGRRFLIA
jgi:hypothetical protein